MNTIFNDLNTELSKTLDAILSFSIDPIYIFNNTGVIIYASAGAEASLGIPIANIIGKTCAELGFAPEVIEPLEIGRRKVVESACTIRHELCLPTVLGIRYYDCILSPIYDRSNTRIDAVLSIARDLTEYKLAEKELKLSVERYKQLFSNINDAIVVHKPPVNGNFPPFIEVNQVACDRLGYTREEMLTLTVPDICPFEAPENVEKVMAKFAADKCAIFETIDLTKDGRKIPVEVNSQLFALDGQPAILSISRDISKRRQLEERVKYVSEHDELTGLFNRTFFEKRLSHYRANRLLYNGIVICDIDNLKIVNDTLGHQFGDKVIVAAATAVKASVGSNDIVSRVGGDEFVILVSESSEHSVQDIYKRIQEAFLAHNANNPHLPIAVSTGYASDKATSIDDLLRQADDNMYKEKLLHHKATDDSTLTMFRQTFEARDFGGSGHLDRLQQMVSNFAEQLGLGQSQITDLRLFAKFHDIGKAIVPDKIIFKPDTLTADEWIEMRRHPEVGYRICKSLPDLVPFPDWILKHHEWWNGTGYPLGLKGEEIPMECRILAIIDAYDAMTSSRPYRKVLSKAEAVAELRRGAGTQFDPGLVEKFISVNELT